MAKTVLEIIASCSDADSLHNMMANAKKQNRTDVWREAFRRLCTLEGLDQQDPLHRDFYAMLRAYEELLTQKNGRTTSASRTRQKLRNKGVIQCLEDWALGKTQTQGFELLTQNGLAELTGEFLVLKYPSSFTPQAIRAARERLTNCGVALPQS
jgi:hypothetical protein